MNHKCGDDMLRICFSPEYLRNWHHSSDMVLCRLFLIDRYLYIHRVKKSTYIGALRAFSRREGVSFACLELKNSREVGYWMLSDVDIWRLHSILIHLSVFGWSTGVSVTCLEAKKNKDLDHISCATAKQRGLVGTSKSAGIEKAVAGCRRNIHIGIVYD